MEKEMAKMMLSALNSVFWYESLLDKQDNNTYSEDCWLIMFIKDLREAKTEYDNYYTTTDLKKFNEQFKEQTNEGNTLDLYNRHTVIWQMLVEMFGNCGTSPRTGWITKRQECADFLQMVVEADLNIL